MSLGDLGLNQWSSRTDKRYFGLTNFKTTDKYNIRHIWYQHNDESSWLWLRHQFVDFPQMPKQKFKRNCFGIPKRVEVNPAQGVRNESLSLLLSPQREFCYPIILLLTPPICNAEILFHNHRNGNESIMFVFFLNFHFFSEIYLMIVFFTVHVTVSSLCLSSLPHIIWQF